MGKLDGNWMKAVLTAHFPAKFGKCISDVGQGQVSFLVIEFTRPSV